MNDRHPLLFVLVDVTRNSGAGFPAMRVGGETACMLVRAGDLDCIDSKLEKWMLATAARFAELKQRYSQLTPRERQALPLITEGMLNKQAASALGISEATLQIHRGRIMQKMAARSFADLVRIADILGISMVGESDDCSRESTRSRGQATATGQVASKDAA
jgi:DNA-binding CsgD family transcriptional regulator